MARRQGRIGLMARARFGLKESLERSVKRVAAPPSAAPQYRHEPVAPETVRRVPPGPGASQSWLSLKTAPAVMRFKRQTSALECDEAVVYLRKWCEYNWCAVRGPKGSCCVWNGRLFVCIQLDVWQALSMCFASKRCSS